MSKNKAAEYIIRFSLNQRVQHIILMVAFIVLAVTGLAEKYYSAGWAEWLILHLGGIAMTHLIHRFFGLIFLLSGLYHFGYLAGVLIFRRVQPSMMPSFNDVRDIIGYFRYAFGISNKPVKFGRYDYRQKFEYWGILFGGTIMTLTGLVLAFPVQTTFILPGQFVAASRVAHSNEAMLAVLTIVIWHLYDVIFKPGIFPGDFSIFTGKISKERLLEEHALEYEEITQKEPEETATDIETTTAPTPPPAPAPPPPPQTQDTQPPNP